MWFVLPAMLRKSEFTRITMQAGLVSLVDTNYEYKFFDLFKKNLGAQVYFAFVFIEIAKNIYKNLSFLRV